MRLGRCVFACFTATAALCALPARAELSPATSHAAPAVAGLLNVLTPGAGYYYLGLDEEAAWSQLLLLPKITTAVATGDTFTKQSAKAISWRVGANIQQFTAYDAYQSALDQRGRPAQVVDLPHYGFKTALAAPFDPHNYATLTVAIPLAVTAATLGAEIARKGVSPRLNRRRLVFTVPMILAQAAFIGMGEESQFRGFQFPAFSELTGSAVGGDIISAAMFGSTHTSAYNIYNDLDLAQDVAYRLQPVRRSRPAEYIAAPTAHDGQRTSDWAYFRQTFVDGLYAGWVVKREQDGLLRAIALHAAYDALLNLTTLITEGSTGRFYIAQSFAMP